MADGLTLVLSRGGLRSLTALGQAVLSTPTSRLGVLWVNDGRSASSVREKMVARQCEHFRVLRIEQIDLPHVRRGRTGGEDRGPFEHQQLLLAGLSRAACLGADRLIWPAQVNGDAEAAAQRLEMTVLARQFAGLDGVEPAEIELPLVELSDRQLVELGAHLRTPFDLSWTCQQAGQAPCRACGPCRRRRAAFGAARVHDPLEPRSRAAS